MEQYFINQQNNNKVTIGGVRKLCDFSSEQVTVMVNNAQVQAKGTKLKIKRFCENEIEIIGIIENVETMASRKRAV